MMNQIVAIETPDKESRLKSGISTAVIVIIMALLLWLYKVNIEEPIPLPEASEVEVLVEPPAGGGGGGGSPSPSEVPVSSTPEVQEAPRSVEQTEVPDAPVVQPKAPETPPAKPVDNTLDEMMRRREEARQKAERDKAGQGSGGQGTGTGSGTGSGTGPGKGSGSGGGVGSGHGPGIGHSFGSGRSFRGGNTTTDCHEAGKVVLEVQLLPNGKIIFQDVSPATNGSDCLVKAAKEILRNSSFNEASSQPTSSGTITFIFKLN